MGKIIAAAPEPFGTILAVTAVLGLRIGETLALRVGDIDFAKHVIRIRQTVDAATRNVQAVKSQASSADVPMPSQLETRATCSLAETRRQERTPVRQSSWASILSKQAA
jgi:integrase